MKLFAPRRRLDLSLDHLCYLPREYLWALVSLLPRTIVEATLRYSSQLGSTALAPPFLVINRRAMLAPQVVKVLVHALLSFHEHVAEL